jgi:hypothetical protein
LNAFAIQSRLRDSVNVIVGLRPVFLGPCTPHGTPGQVVRTWGTRPVLSGSAMTQALRDSKRSAKRNGQRFKLQTAAPNNYLSSSVSCRACPHPRGRLWPWPRLRSCMRRLWSYRSTWSPGSDRPWWMYSTKPGPDHRREREWSMLPSLPWSWVTERRPELE